MTTTTSRPECGRCGYRIEVGYSGEQIDGDASCYFCIKQEAVARAEVTALSLIHI